MKRILALALAIAVSVGTTAMLNLNRKPRDRRQAAEAQLASDGAFRDGLYLGRLAASERRPMQSPLGRWSSEKDRASFDAGYRRGYSSFLTAEVGE